MSERALCPLYHRTRVSTYQLSLLRHAQSKHVLVSRTRQPCGPRPIRQITRLCDRPTFCAHLSFTLQVALVAHYDDREVVLVLDPQYLLLECHDLLVALAGRDAVHQQEPFTCSHVLLAHRRILFLTGRVEDIEERDFIVNHALLAVGV